MSKTKWKRPPVVTLTVEERCDCCGTITKAVYHHEHVGYPLPKTMLWRVRVVPPDLVGPHLFEAAVCEPCAKAIAGERVTEQIDGVIAATEAADAACR